MIPPLDAVAALFTMSSTPLLATNRRGGWLMLAGGAALWLLVGLTETLWGLVASSVWTIGWSLRGWLKWRRIA